MLEIFHWEGHLLITFSERSDPISYFQKKFEANRLRIRKVLGLQSFLSGHYREQRLRQLRYNNSLQTQRIDLKLSTFLFEAKSGAKCEDGQNRTKLYSCHGYLIETKVGSMGQKNYFVRMTWKLVHLYICWLEIISEKIIKFGWKLKKL